MLRMISGAMSAALSMMAVVACAPAGAAPSAERELLGVRLWRDYAAVLKVHGEPTRVVPGMALPPEVGVGSINVGMQAGQPGRGFMAGAPMGGTSMGIMGPPTAPMMGGMLSAGGMSTPPLMGGGRSMPMMGGMAGGAGLMGRRQREEDEDDIGAGTPLGGQSGRPAGGMSAPMGMGAPMGGMSAPMGGMGNPRMGAGRGMPMVGGMGGMTAPPSYAGGAGMMGGLSGDPALMGTMLGAGMGTGMAGAPGSVGAQSQVSASVPSEEVKETWVYVKGQHTYHFMFNKDGRVIRIQSFGPKGTGATSRSIALGDPISKVYAKYGWPDTTIRQTDSVTLDYSQKAHVIFDLVDRHDGKGLRVVGITIAPSEGRR